MEAVMEDPARVLAAVGEGARQCRSARQIAEVAGVSVGEARDVLSRAVADGSVRSRLVRAPYRPVFWRPAP